MRASTTFSVVLLSSISSFAIATTSHAGVIVIDGAGGGNYTSLEAGIAAAADGDILLVRPSSYFELYVTIDDKALTLISDPPGAVVRILSFDIKNLAAGKTIVCRGLQFGVPSTGGFVFPYFGVSLSNDAGSVWFQDCKLYGGSTGGFGSTTPPAAPGVQIQNCASTTFVNCTLEGGRGSDQFVAGPAGSYGPGDGGPGARITGGTRAAFYRCTITGGGGGTGSLYHGANGGSGFDSQASTALVSGCTITGGKGGTGCSPSQIPMWGNGGAGIAIDAAALLQRQDTTTAGGAPGADTSGNLGLPGPATIGSLSSIIDLQGPARSLSVTSPVREQQPVTMTILGEPNDVAMFLLGFNGASFSLPANQGWLLLGPPWFGAFVIGTLPGPSGDVALPFTAPDLASPAMAGQQFLLQPVFQHSTGFALGAPTCFVLIDSTL